MPDKENFNAVIQESISEGGCTIMGESVAPTLVSSQYKGPGNTQDNLSVVTYRKQGHPQNSEQGQGWEETTINDTLNVFDNSEGRTPTLITQKVYDWHRQDTRMTELGDICVTAAAAWGEGGNNMPYVLEQETYQETTGSLCASGYDKLGTQEAMNDMYVVSQKNMPTEEYDKCYEEHAYNCMTALDCRKCKHSSECVRFAEWWKNNSCAPSSNAVVRRLTPLECERLQSFPDGWTDIGDWIDSKGKKHKGDSDSPRYKALGNSIALPYWQWLMNRMAIVLKEDGIENPTMASLFDGISGFCLCAKRAGIEPLFSSEIEDFPIAVAKRHFGDEETGEVGDIEKYL